MTGDGDGDGDGDHMKATNPMNCIASPRAGSDQSSCPRMGGGGDGGTGSMGVSTAWE